MWHIKAIPKILHVYWGGSILSYLRFLTIITFRKQNPDWKIKFYYPKEKYRGGKEWSHQEIDLVCKDYTPEIKNITNIELIEIDFDVLGIGHVPEVYRSDLLRLKLLGTEGGLYSDMDIIYFRPLEEAYFNALPYQGVDTIISYHPLKNHYSIGFLMAGPNNKFYKFLYDKGLEKIGNRNDKEYQRLGVIMWKSYFNTPGIISSKFPNLEIFDIKMDLTYSLESNQVNMIYNQDIELTNPKTIALHIYLGHPWGPKMENLLTEETIYTVNNTITRAIRRACYNVI